MLVTCSVVTGATAVRVGVGGVTLATGRTPALVRLGLDATVLGRGRAQGAFRDELLGLLRDGTERVWRELRRGIDVLDESTRQDAPGPAPTGRRYRVKP
jgi:hypothetical protein